MTTSSPSSRPTVAPAAITPTPRVPRRIQALIALVAVGVTTAAAMGWAGGPRSTADAAAAQGATVAATGHTTEVTIVVDGMSFTPDVIEVPAGDSLVITFHNTGDQRHDLVLANGVATPAIAPGATATVSVATVTGNLDGWCSLPGHRAMGMELTIIAAGVGADGTEAQQHNMTEHMAGTGQDLQAPSMADLRAAAKAADPVPAALEPLSGDTHHEYTFTVRESTDTVAPGVTRAVWTYNGTTPGPTLHGRIGDTFRITLVNEGTMGHSIDFHAGEVAPDEPMRTIEPGESLVYEFTANRAGIWMYHCGTMPMTQHIANGMFGAVIIEPDDLEPVDREYVLIQSGIYLGKHDGAASATKLAAAQPDIVALNGRAFQYVAHPLSAAVGERVRFWVLDAGPNAPLSFHVVGAQFDTVWSEGAYSVFRGRSTDGITQGVTGAQVLPLMAAQGGFVEMVATEPGHYPFVNHLMTSVDKGAQGILEVTD